MPRIDKTNKTNSLIAVPLRKSVKDKTTSTSSAEVGKDAAKQVSSKVGSPVSVRQAFNASTSKLPARQPNTALNKSPRPQVVTSASWNRPENRSAQSDSEWADWDHKNPPDASEYLTTCAHVVGKLVDKWEVDNLPLRNGLEHFVSTSNSTRSKFLIRQILDFNSAISPDQAKVILRDGIAFLSVACDAVEDREFVPHNESLEDFADNVVVFFAVLPSAMEKASPDLLQAASGPGVPHWESALREIARTYSAIGF